DRDLQSFPTRRSSDLSYVLNGKMTERINPQTAAKIKSLAKELNYQPNQIAKSLKNKKTHTLGLIVADISNFFYSYLARYVEEERSEEHTSELQSRENL